MTFFLLLSVIRVKVAVFESTVILGGGGACFGDVGVFMSVYIF